MITSILPILRLVLAWSVFKAICFLIFLVPISFYFPTYLFCQSFHQYLKILHVSLFPFISSFFHLTLHVLPLQISSTIVSLYDQTQFLVTIYVFIPCSLFIQNVPHSLFSSTSNQLEKYLQ